MWQQWINAVLGLAVLATPFLALSSETLTWTLVVLGAAVAVLALWGGMQEQTERQQYREGYRERRA